MTAETPTRLINRELSWLDFNARVLALAADDQIPLLSRLTFCGIWASNLDEYFQVRIAGLLAQLASGDRRAVDGLSTTEQLTAIRARLLAQSADAYKVYEDIVVELSDEGIELVAWESLGRDEKKSLTEIFTSRIFPVLTPLAVDPGHPFPYISTLSLSLAVLLAEPDETDNRFARVKVPTEVLGRHLKVPGTERRVALEDVIAANLDLLFPGIEIVSSGVFRVSRDADLDIDERDADDLLIAVESELQQRRFGSIVRLEVQRGMPAEILDRLLDELDLSPESVYEVDGPVDLSSVAAIKVEARPELLYTRWEPRRSPALSDEDGAKDFFSVLKKRDVLVHHPYVSFNYTVLEFIRQAAADDSVLAIKVTLYRTSGDGQIVDALIRAAASGKQVVAVFELKARFDEEANIEGARRLERAGVHVTYGLVGLKVHSKVALVVRQESDGELRRYSHIGTGNYNSKTALLYTDIGLLTSDDVIGADLSRFFNSLTGYGNAPEFERIIVAPDQMRPRLAELIRNEATYGPGKGRILAKMNSLVDPEMIEELYAASGAGVDVDLIVRGTCCLRPGVPGMSDRIRVRSVLGRFLEHSRVYVFANGAGPGVPLYLIGSADLMPRNLNRRVEALVPIDAVDAQDEIELILGINLADDTTAWELASDGAWNRLSGPQGIGTHARLQEFTR